MQFADTKCKLESYYVNVSEILELEITAMEIIVPNAHYKAQSPIQRKFSPYNTPETKCNDCTEHKYLSKKN